MMDILSISQKYFIDAHCHLSSPEIRKRVTQEIRSAKDANIDGFISTALTYSEYKWHADNPIKNVFITAGIHPHYEVESPLDLSKLNQLAKDKKIWGIGEIGLDKRNGNIAAQREILTAQLEIARDYNLPVVFHTVGRYNELYNLLNDSFPTIKGYLHGFVGSKELVNMYKQLNLGFSIGSRIFAGKHGTETLGTIIDYGFYFFETDAPYLLEPFYSGNKYLINLNKVIKQTAAITNTSIHQLCNGQHESFCRLSGS